MKEKTDRELIREIINDHPVHIFWDGKKRNSNPLTASEVFKLLGKEIQDNDRGVQLLQGQN